MDKKINEFKSLLQLNEELSQINDLDAVLDYLLTKARKMTNADGGTIYIAKEDKLKFSYTQNDTLFSSNLDNKNLYSNLTINIDETSIAGYSAYKKELLNIPDCYKLGDRFSYHFNSSWDKKSGYHTQSMLTQPIKNVNDVVVGVIQLINAKDSSGKIIPFSKDDEVLISYFAGNASVHIERANLTRELILRMIKMAELRDPKETGPHVNRVGAFAAELYEHWATKNNISYSKIKKLKGNMRLSAMLHDVGKIAISDTILKKPGRFDDEERAIIKTHTIFGAQLFKNSTSELDKLSLDIALNHHERWDGKGYPGKVKDIYSEDVKMAEGKKADEIPLCGRIVAIADVYDALMSSRYYKESWTEKDTLNEIKKCGGTQFDPKLVNYFMEIHATIHAIRAKYQD
ncbi:MAG: HD domain-containing protein [Candidatus Cloacimonetes bacterium]|nr:HD domain-containing protein [Candidatus Cloacimonadota bacterium]